MEAKPISLTNLIEAVNSHDGPWAKSTLASDVDLYLWQTYDPRDDLIYPNIEHWDDLLKLTIEDGDYAKLRECEVLSILFGLHHRTRIIDSLWTSMFERGVTQKLLERLLQIDTNKAEPLG